MGLAPYGSPRFRDLILDNLIDLKADGSFRLDLSYFDYCVGLRMTNAKFEQLFGGPARKPESPITQRDMDLAASIQSVTEEVILRLDACARGRNRMQESLSRRRRGAQLRCQRQGLARPSLRKYLDSTRRR